MVKFFLNLKDCTQYAGTDYTQDSQKEFFSGFRGRISEERPYKLQTDW
jgi:hypothetical protein